MRYDGPASSRDLVRSLAVSRDGSTVFVTGESLGVGTGYDYATVAYDAARGDEIWTTRHDGAASPAAPKITPSRWRSARDVLDRLS